MSVIADFTVPTEEFPLGDLLTVRNGGPVRLETMVPVGDGAIPYVWVQDADIEDVEAALAGSPLVESVRVVDRIGDEGLLRVEWATQAAVDGVIASIDRFDGVVLDAEGVDGRWAFQLRFPEYDSLSAFYRDVVDRSISIDLVGVHDSVETSDAATYGLTPEQYEALSVAYAEGYFAVPREITLVELAGALGISDSAVSQRIRRGLANVIAATVGLETPDRRAAGRPR